MHDLIEGMRIYVVVASLVVAIVGTLQWRRWVDFKPENRLAWLAIVALNASMGFGTFETLRLDIPGGLRTYVAAMAMSFLLVAVLYHPWTAWRERHRSKETP